MGCRDGVIATTNNSLKFEMPFFTKNHSISYIWRESSGIITIVSNTYKSDIVVVVIKFGKKVAEKL